MLGGLYTDRGGFHIWPEGTDVSSESDQTERAVTEVMQREFGSRAYRAARNFAILAGASVAFAMLLRWSWSP